MRMSELLNEVRRFELDEGFSPREIKMAIGIASDPRYAKGNMTGAVNAIEKMKKGLSDHPQVAAVLKRQNEDLDEASKEGTIKIIKTKDGKFQIQKMTKGKFVDIGKPHNSAKEAEKFRSGQPDLFGEASRIVEPYRPEFGLDEAPKMTYALVGTDMKIYAIDSDEKDLKLNRRSLEKRLKDVSPLKIARLKTAQSIGDKVDKSQLKEEVELDERRDPVFKVSKGPYAGKYAVNFTLDRKKKTSVHDTKADAIKYVQGLRKNKDAKIDDGQEPKKRKFKSTFMKGISPDAFQRFMDKQKAAGLLSKEEVEIDEKYDLYHKDFSSAMQHAYSYAKSKMGITVDPKEIDSKVATGPKKPTEGKTNKYMLKGKGGNLQIQVYNKGGSKPFELNMYKEENQLISLASKHISHMQMSERKVDPADVDDNASEKDVEDAGKNIIMQLRKSVSMRGNKDVEFSSGKQKVDMKIAQKALDMYNKMKPQDKMKFQTTIAKSYKDLLNAIKGN